MRSVESRPVEIALKQVLYLCHNPSTCFSKFRLLCACLPFRNPVCVTLQANFRILIFSYDCSRVLLLPASVGQRRQGTDDGSRHFVKPMELGGGRIASRTILRLLARSHMSTARRLSSRSGRGGKTPLLPPDQWAPAGELLALHPGHGASQPLPVRVV